jgi:hypothetical protein
MNVPKVNEIDMVSVWWGLELQSQYPPTNKQWFRLQSDWIVHVRTDTSKNKKLRNLRDIKNDPWDRPLIPWKFKYAVPGEEFYDPTDWKVDSDGTHGAHRFYRYVTVDGKFVKLKLIFKHE